jgi:hypothetical protein
MRLLLLTERGKTYRGTDLQRPELYIFSQGPVVLVTAYSIDGNHYQKLMRPAVRTPRCHEADWPPVVFKAQLVFPWVLSHSVTTALDRKILA